MSVEGVGLKLGQILVDKDTGRTKVTQEVQGIDLGDYFQKIRQSKTVKIDQEKESLDICHQKIQAFSTLKTKAETLSEAVAKLANRFPGMGSSVPNAMSYKAIQVVGGGSSLHGQGLEVEGLDSARIGTHTVTVEQIAESDSYHCSVTLLEGRLSPLRLNGTLTIGTVEPGSAQTITLTPTMTLPDLVAQLNESSALTGVRAEMSLYSPNNPNHYTLSLTAKAVGTPIILTDGEGGILNNLGLALPPASCLNTALSSPNLNENLGLTGTLTITGGTQPLSLNCEGLSVNQIVSQINQSNSGVSAELNPLIPGLNGEPTVYQLTLKGATGQPLTVSESSQDVKAALGLTSPFHDYRPLMARLTIDGVSYERGTNSVQDVKPGLTFHLKQAHPETSFQVHVIPDKEGCARAVESMIQAYNDLSGFLKKQTAMTSDFSGPMPEAYLAEDPWVTRLKMDLQRSLSFSQSTNPLSTLQSLGFGISLQTGEIELKDPKKWQEAMTHSYDSVINLFQNKVTSSSPHLQVVKAPFWPEALSGKPIAFQITANGEGTLSGSATLNNTVYPLAFSQAQGRTLVTLQNEGLGLSDVQFQIVPPPAGQSLEATLTLETGLMGKIDTFLQSQFSPLLSQNKSSFESILEMAQGKEKKITDEMDRLKKSIDQEMESLERKFDAVLKAKANYEMAQGMLKGFFQANSR